MPLYDDGYLFTRDDFVVMLARKWFPERTDRESRVMIEYLAAHHVEFDRLIFGKRVGAGLEPDPSHLEGVQRNTSRFTKKRIDILGWTGNQPTIVEVKERITPASLGQILTYRQLLLEEMPDAPEPRLVVIGRYSDDDTIRALTGHGVTVYVYPAPEPAGNVAGVG